MKIDIEELIKEAGDVAPTTVLTPDVFNQCCKAWNVKPCMSWHNYTDMWSAVCFFTLGAAAAMRGLVHRVDEEGQIIE